MRNNIIILLLLLIGATACSEKSRINTLSSLSESCLPNERIEISEDSVIELKKESKENCVKIKIPQEISESSLDTIFSNYSFVPLQTTEKCIIGRIEKILVCEDCFCILDRDNSNVFLFELDGRFRCRLGEKGHGPGEHLDAWNVAYDERHHEVVLLDLTGRKLMHYNMEGKLLKEEPMFYLYDCFEYQDDNMVIGTGKAYNDFSDILNLYQLIIADRSQMPIARGFKISSETRQNFHYSPRLKKCNREIVYDDMLSDTLWCISEKKKIPLLTIDFGEGARFGEDEKVHMTDNLFDERQNRTGTLNDWQFSPSYISLLVCTPNTRGSLFNVLYSRKGKRCKLFGFNKVAKRLGDYLTMSSFDGVYNDNTFIRIVEPMDILE